MAHREEENVEEENTTTSAAYNRIPSSQSKRRASAFLDSLRLDVTYSYHESKKNKVQYCIGCTSVFVVVVIVVLLQTALSYAPIIFMGMAEATQGEIDMLITAGGWTADNRINFTRIENILMSNNLASDLSSPRYTDIAVDVYNLKKCKGFTSHLGQSGISESLAFNNSWSYWNETSLLCSEDFNLCFQRSACSSVAVSGSLNVLDVTREKNANIGRNINLDPLNAGTVYLVSNLALQLGVQKDDYIIVRLSIDNWFRGITLASFPQLPIDVSDPITGKIYDEFNLYQIPIPQSIAAVNIVFKVADILDADSISKKFQSTDSLDNMIISEYSTFLPHLSKMLNPMLKSGPSYKQVITRNYSSDDGGVAKGFADSNLYDYAGQVLFSCAKDRFTCYLQSSFNRIASSLITWSSDLSFKIGFNQLNIVLPVLSELQSLQMFNAFMSLILNICILVLGALSVFLIYSLLLVSIETKTFELGVLRMVGMARRGVIQLLMIQALSFSVPALILGLIVGESVFLIVRIVFANVTGISISPFLTGDAVLLAVFLGFFIPVLSSILPIRQALSTNLHDSLDTRSSKTKAVVITVERSQESGFAVDWTNFTIGGLLTVFGFIVYYVLPLALLNSNITVLFNIFLLLLMGMLFGLVILALNVQPLVEQLLIAIFFFPLRSLESKAIPIIIAKNLVAHRIRNRKTSIMYALGLGFIIFLSVGIRIQLQSTIFSEARSAGTRFSLQNWNINSDGTAQGIEPKADIEKFLTESEIVDSFCWITYNLGDVSTSIIDTYLHSIGNYISNSQSIYGVSPNFFDIIDQTFVQMEIDSSLPQLPAGELLYTLQGSNSIFLPGYFKQSLNLRDYGQQFYVTKQSSVVGSAITDDTWVMKALGFINNIAIFYMTKFPADNQDIIVSLPTFAKMANVTSLENLPMRRLLIKLKSSFQDTSAVDTPAVPFDSKEGQMLRNLSSLLSAGWIEDSRDSISKFADTTTIINMIFQLMTLVAMIIAFFSLNSSMFTNIIEQAKEIGVMRALGVKKFMVYRIFIYEAFILVLSSALMGLLIGIIVGIALSAQRSVLTQIPLNFQFPYDLFLLILASSIVCSILSTVSPVFNLIQNQNIVSLMKK